jgi:hypothetical protein
MSGFLRLPAAAKASSEAIGIALIFLEAGLYLSNSWPLNELKT